MTTALSLQDKLSGFSSPVQMLRTSQAGPYVHPIPAEFSNWRSEQLAWRDSVALMDQSFHMVDLYVEGPDVLRLLSDLSVNTYKNFGANKAKQLIACGHDGKLIGDMILFGLEANRVNIVGRPTVANWVQFNIERGDYDVRNVRDERSVDNKTPRRNFRFELQGPKAWALLEKLNGGPLPDIPFFGMGAIRVAGHEFRCLRHGMGGAAGLEFWGSIELGAEVKATILAAGADFGLRQVGGRAYSSAAVDSGWLPCPLPAIYSSELMRPYREWLSANSFDAIPSLGGSFYSDNIEDYYFSPWDLDYGRLVRFDHDFIGRSALEQQAKLPHRKKVSLVWNADDVSRVNDSFLRADRNFKYMEAPTAHYAGYPYDAVLKGDRIVGVSTYIAYLMAEKAWVSLAVLDEDVATLGNEVVVVWGERNGGSSRPLVEPHAQTEIRAKVHGWPISANAREHYRTPA